MNGKCSGEVRHGVDIRLTFAYNVLEGLGCRPVVALPHRCPVIGAQSLAGHRSIVKTPPSIQVPPDQGLTAKKGRRASYPSTVARLRGGWLTRRPFRAPLPLYNTPPYLSTPPIRISVLGA